MEKNHYGDALVYAKSSKQVHTHIEQKPQELTLLSTSSSAVGLVSGGSASPYKSVPFLPIFTCFLYV